MQVFHKDPDEVLDYGVDWTAWMAAGDTIDTSTWVKAGSAVIDSTAVDGLVTSVWLSGGMTGEFVRLTNRIVTTDGRTAERSLMIVIEER